MRIGIIGGGSIGLLFASYLSQSHDITIYTRRSEQAEAIIKSGITLKIKDAFYKQNVKAQANFEGINLQDLVIIAIKQYDLSLLLKNKEITHVNRVLFLQNGMSHIDVMNQISSENIYLGVVEHGALKHNDTTVEHTGIGITKISPFRGNLSNINFVFDHHHSQFPFQYYDDWNDILIAKLVVNAVINPLTSIFRVRNGDLVKNPYLKQITEKLFVEIIRALNIKEAKELWEYVQSVSRNTAPNRSSMLKDIEEGRETEIDAILGYILNKSDKANSPIMTFVYNAIKGLELERRE